MTDPIAITTLVLTTVMPIATVLVGAIAYSVRKFRRSSCCSCFTFDSGDNSPTTAPETKEI